MLRFQEIKYIFCIRQEIGIIKANPRKGLLKADIERVHIGGGLYN